MLQYCIAKPQPQAQAHKKLARSPRFSRMYPATCFLAILTATLGQSTGLGYSDGPILGTNLHLSPFQKKSKVPEVHAPRICLKDSKNIRKKWIFLSDLLFMTKHENVYQNLLGNVRVHQAPGPSRWPWWQNGDLTLKGKISTLPIVKGDYIWRVPARSLWFSTANLGESCKLFVPAPVYLWWSMIWNQLYSPKKNIDIVSRQSHQLYVCIRTPPPALRSDQVPYYP